MLQNKRSLKCAFRTHGQLKKTIFTKIENETKKEKNKNCVISSFVAREISIHSRDSGILEMKYYSI